MSILGFYLLMNLANTLNSCEKGSKSILDLKPLGCPRVFGKKGNTHGQCAMIISLAQILQQSSDLLLTFWL